MVETISPVGYGARTGRWLAAVGLHALGATVTAAAFGAALGAVGSLLHAPWGVAGLGVLAAAAFAYAAREVAGLPLLVPAARRQVPDWWRSFFSWPVAATLYGAGLGIGFLTFLTNGGLVVVAVAAVISGHPTAGGAVMGVFGLARGLSPLIAWPVRTREAGTALVDRLAASDPVRWRRANAAALSLVGAGSLVALAQAAGPMGAGAASAAAGIVTLAFAWSASAKLVAPVRWRRTLAGYSLPQPVSRFAAVAVPLTEAAVPLVAILGAPDVASAVALACVCVFSAAILRARVRGGDRAVSCGCFGGSRVHDYRLLLARNAVLAAAAAIGLRAPTPEVTWWPGIPSSAELLPFALATTAAAVAVLTAWRSGSWIGRGRRA
jgi:hypothetical protein